MNETEKMIVSYQQLKDRIAELEKFQVEYYKAFNAGMERAAEIVMTTKLYPDTGDTYQYLPVNLSLVAEAASDRRHETGLREEAAA